MDQSGSCLEWRLADLLEGVPTDKPLKIRWEPVFYEGGPVYYQVRILNWMRGLPLYRSPLVAATEITIPAEMIQRILIDNATYIMQIWAFDDATIPNSHNRSRSDHIRFATGNVSFTYSPIFDYARVVRSNFPGNYFEVNYAARVRNGLTGGTLTGNDIRVFAYKPNNEVIELTNWTAGGDVWQIPICERPCEQPVGEYIFQAVLINDLSKYVILRDYYYRPRSLPIPELNSPGTPWPEQIPWIDTLWPTFSWKPVDGAKYYELLLDEWKSGSWSRIYISPWVEETNLTLPFELGNGKTYRWSIRAYDSFSMDTIDNRSNSLWYRFSVQAQ